MKQLICILLLLCSSIRLSAGNTIGEKKSDQPTVEISGKITSVSGEEIPGARIENKASGEVFFADLNGNFSVKISNDPNLSLYIQQLGYTPVQVKFSELRDFSEVKLSEL